MKPIVMASLGLAVLLAACNPAKEDQPDGANDQPEFSENFDPAQKSLIRGKAFLDENKNAEGVITTDTGLQYKVIKAGPVDGKHPYPGQFVCVNYEGKTIDGKEFDSSYTNGVPAVFPSNGLIKGWVEALAIMRPGDEWKLYIAPNLAYGASGTMGGPIGPNETLVFKISLIKLMDISVDEYRRTYGVDQTLDCSKAS
ncbi:MAG: peptidylprolyl isomerase [Robiginitomaculum sp.]|nr:MAG: peptidylprolyl isomerase [Robiginitomaculum sp.]